MRHSPVQVEVARPERFDRAQVLLRILVVVALGVVGLTPWPFGLLYLGLPIAAAVLLSTRPAERFVDEDAPRIARGIGWLIELFAWLALVIDRPPFGAERPLRVSIAPSGSPTVGSALLRLLTAIPSALVLCLLGLVAAIAVVIGAIAILITTKQPEALWALQLAVVRWQARLLAYLGSLVPDYPPFVVDTAHGGEPPRVEASPLIH
jgi:hypothetical protein